MASNFILKNDLGTELAIIHKNGQPAKTIYTDGLTNAVDTIADMEALITGPVTSAYDGNVCFVKDLDRGGSFVYDKSKVSEDNQGTNFNGWIRQYDGAVNVKWFGAKGDSVTDNTNFLKKAFDYGIINGVEIFFPSGRYRVVNGYKNETLRGTLSICGEGYIRELHPETKATIIILDNADINSYFYKTSIRSNIKVDNVIFSCEKYVKDRKFFHLIDDVIQFLFYRVYFESVEKPIYLDGTFYTQMSKLDTVQFRNSGMIYTSDDNLKGTLLILNNVNHEVKVPTNTEKIVCNLKGFRNVHATNLLFEGELPEDNTWSILTLGCIIGNVYVTGEDIFECDFLHSEWIAGKYPKYVLHQTGGNSTISGAGIIGTNRYIKLDNYATLKYKNSQIDKKIEECSDIQLGSNLIVDNCFLRYFPQNTIENITIMNSHNKDDANTSFGSISNKILEFKGIPFDDVALVNGTEISLEVDSNNKRIMAIYNSTSSGINFTFPINDLTNLNCTVNLGYIIALPKIPDGGYFQIRFIEDGTTEKSYTYNSADSLKIVNQGVSYAKKVKSSVLSICFSSSSDVTENILVHGLVISKGKSFIEPAIVNRKFITYFSDKLPSKGSYMLGDKIYNTSPSAGGTIGWVCTSSGSYSATEPTWKTFGTIES